MRIATLTLIKSSPTWTEYRITSPKFGAFRCYKFTPVDGDLFGNPVGRPWHLVTTGMYFASPEAAAEYLDAQDWSEPTVEQLERLRRQDAAAHQKYMHGVEYVCGIVD